ncbi:MAG: hypothetical protein H7840_00430 [Alphaproteobacteria bacterium]
MTKRRWIRALFVMVLSLGAFTALMAFPCWTETVILINGTTKRIPRVDVKFGDEVLWRGSLAQFDGYRVCVYVPKEGRVDVEIEFYDGNILFGFGPYTTELQNNGINLFYVFQDRINYTGISSFFYMKIGKESPFHMVADFADIILTKMTCPLTMIIQYMR